MTKTQNKAFIIPVSDTTEGHKAVRNQIITLEEMEARQQRPAQQKPRTFSFWAKITPPFRNQLAETLWEGQPPYRVIAATLTFYMSRNDRVREEAKTGRGGPPR